MRQSSAETFYPVPGASAKAGTPQLPLDNSVESLLEACRPPADTATVYPPESVIPTPLMRYQARAVGWRMRRETELDTEAALPYPQWMPLRSKALASTPHLGEDVSGRKKRKGVGKGKSVKRAAKGKGKGKADVDEAVAQSSSQAAEEGCRKFYIDVTTGMLSLRRFMGRRSEPGGCLAEEMGLGKTLEILSLIATHERTDAYVDQSRSRKLMDELPKDERPIPVKSTLIICPAAIAEQWTEEVRKHYRGSAGQGANGLNDKTILFFNSSTVKWDAHSDPGTVRVAARALFDCDIVISTYETLVRELAKSHRSMYVKSPLLEVQVRMAGVQSLIRRSCSLL